jgi:hypothetical protein
MAALTYDVECNEVAHFGLGADLTLVLAGVARLHVLDLQGPRVRRLNVERLEAFVRDERVPVHSQNVRVPPSYPRDLRHTNREKTL